MDKIIALIIIIIGCFLLVFSIYHINKINCEKNGGKYIFEYGNKGSNCHLGD